MDISKKKQIMVWAFSGNQQMYEALDRYGDRMNRIGMCCFKVSGKGEIQEEGLAIDSLEPYVSKWPHITWLATISNEGDAGIFAALRGNTDGTRDVFLTELVRILKKYPWCGGVDIDLENGGGYDTAGASVSMYRDIYDSVKAYDPEKEVNICLPGMVPKERSDGRTATGPGGGEATGPGGGEEWCVYGNLDPYCDTACIMSYDVTRADSAPGPASPRKLLEKIYDYAACAMTPGKVFFGMGAYGWDWRINDTPENMGRKYRGTSQSYQAAVNWLAGKYNHTGDAPPQPFIPCEALWDDENMAPYALPHVYDVVQVEEPLVSSTSYNLSPRLKKDVNGEMTGPATGFKLAFEVCRRPPDTALIWQDDFREGLRDTYYIQICGEWKKAPEGKLEGRGQLALKHGKFRDIDIRAEIAFPDGFSGRAGVFSGSLFCCFNCDSRRVELYEGNVLKGSCDAFFERTDSENAAKCSGVCTIGMLKRGRRVMVYSGSNVSPCFTAECSDADGYAGIMSDCSGIICRMLRIGDAWVCEPHEKFDVILPDGRRESFGREKREGVKWDEEFQVFRADPGAEKRKTKAGNASSEYEFFHSQVMTDMKCGNDYTVTVIPADTGVRIRRIFLGDADGFSILYYQDATSLVYWFNRAADLGFGGMCMWSLGQEDMRLWELLPKQT